MSRGSYIPELTRMALDNAWARAHELGNPMPAVLGRCFKAGMTVQDARKTVEACRDKRNPHVFCSACLKRWKDEE